MTADGAVTDESTGRGWRLLRAAIAEQRNGFLVATSLGMVWTAGKIAVPQLVRLGIDEGIVGGGSLLGWASLLMGVAVVAGLFSGFRRFYAFRESRLIETRLRERIFARLQTLDASYHDRSQTGQLMSRASSDLQLIQGFTVMIPLTITNAAIIVAAVAVLFSSDPFLAAVALAPLPLVNVITKMFASRIHPAALAVQQEQAELASVVEESVSGVRVIKGFGAESVQASKLAKEADDIRTTSMAAARIRSTFMPLLDFLPTVGLVAVLGIGGHRVLNGEMTVGGFVAFNSYLALLIQPLRTIGMTVAFGQRAATACMRIDEILAAVPLVAESDRPIALPPAGTGAAAVEFDDVSFAYPTTSVASGTVLESMSLTILHGESVAVVGETGSGKSTLTRLLLRFYDPQRGSIRLDGVDLRSLSLADLRRSVAVVFEETLLFNDTVAANIAFARPDASMETVRSAARLAGADEFVRELPDGYDTIVGERGYSLSGGQRQRIAIARAIVADPRVLVLDDATSAVDPTKETEIRDALATVMRGRTTIVIAHRPATIELASRVVLLDRGRIAASGTHRELLESNSRYREVLAAYSATDGATTPAGVTT